MERLTSRVVAEGLGFGECPRWRGGRLWFSDFYRHGIFSVAPDGGDERLEHAVAELPSGLGWTPAGDLVFVSMTDRRVVTLGSSPRTVDISAYCGFWANDMVVSSSGYCYVGNLGFDFDARLEAGGVEGLLASPPPTTNLVVIDPDGTVVQAVDQMAFPYGTVVTPDGRTLIVGETMASRLTAFDIDPGGTLGGRRVWAQLDFVATDGMCLDAEGQIWLANAATNEQPQTHRRPPARPDRGRRRRRAWHRSPLKVTPGTPEWSSCSRGPVVARLLR